MSFDFGILWHAGTGLRQTKDGSDQFLARFLFLRFVIAEIFISPYHKRSM